MLLNKVDLAGEPRLAEIEARVREINSTAEVIRCQNAAAPLAKLFGVGAFDLVHTIWLHQLYIFSPTTDLDAPVDYVCGTRQGGPSYALSLALLSLACVFNEDVRRILARRTGGRGCGGRPR